MFMFLPILILFQAPAPQVPRLEAAGLQVVPGPMAPKGPDLGLDPSGSDIRSQMRHSFRRSGTVPAVAVPACPIVIEDQMKNSIPGWKAYRLEVAPKAAIHVRLRGVHEAWFKVSCVNRWGEMEVGMLQNRIPTGNPEAKYVNPKAEPRTVWFVVDLQTLDATEESYTLEFTALPVKP